MNNFLVILPSILMVILLNADLKYSFEFDIKFNTLLLIFGNFAIAVYIAGMINKKLKNHELKINNSFTELDFLLTLLSDLRKCIMDNENLIDNITRYTSLVSLQIELIKKYPFIDESHKEKLFEQYYELDKHLTDGNEVDQKYKGSLLKLEKTVLNIKSDIL